jgi:hypothetical protein
MTSVTQRIRLQQHKDLRCQLLSVSFETSKELLPQMTVTYQSAYFGIQKVKNRSSNFQKKFGEFIGLQDEQTTTVYAEASGQKLFTTCGPVVANVLVEEGYLVSWRAGAQSMQLWDLSAGQEIPCEASTLVYLPSWPLHVQQLASGLFLVKLGTLDIYTQRFRFCSSGILTEDLHGVIRCNTEILESFPKVQRELHEVHANFNVCLRSPFGLQPVVCKQSQSFPAVCTLSQALRYARSVPEDLVAVSNRIIDVDEDYSRAADVNALHPIATFPSYSQNLHLVLPEILDTPQKIMTHAEREIAMQTQRTKLVRKLLENGFQVDLLHQLTKYPSVFPSVYPILKKELTKSRTLAEFLQLCGHMCFHEQDARL